MGSEDKQYQVIVDPQKLLAFNLSLKQVFTALEANNAMAGGGYIQHEREQFLIRGEALASNVEDLAQILVDHHPGGVPIYIKDVAKVQEGGALRIGAATRMGEGETVIGMVQMLAGTNAQQVLENVKARIQEIQKSLPAGVILEPYYDRSVFVSQVIQTVRNNLLEGGLLVVAILFAFLGDLRAGLIVASAIPLSMLLAFMGMVQVGLSGNLMSLGAIDFGLLVDGSVVMIDNILRKLGTMKDPTPEARMRGIQESAREVLRPVAFAVGIIILVYIPVLSLTGLEGKMFCPMAITVIFALAGSLAFAMTVVPALGYWLARPKIHGRETRMVQWALSLYEPVLRFSIRRPVWVVTPTIVLFAVSVLLAGSLGIVFMPRLDEGDMAIMVWRLPSVSISESVETALAVEQVIRQFPEVTQVVSRTGNPEVAKDPMGIELSDVFVNLKPRDEWTSATTKKQLIERMKQAILHSVPGVGLSFTQPIEMRFNELIAGTRSDVAVKIFGEDLAILGQQAESLARILEKIPGAADVKVEQVSGVPRIRIVVDRDQIARYGVDAADILSFVQSARVGQVVGIVFEGERRFQLVVRLADKASAGPSALGNLLAPTPHGELVPLSRITTIFVDEGPAQVSREGLHRRIVVESNIRGRDLGSFVSQAQEIIAESMNLPPGYYVQ